MGPGDGWFHGSQSRFSWDWLVARCDDNSDGEIDPEEFHGSPAAFARLDRDGDGRISREDFNWSDSSPFLRQQGQARQWFAGIDTSSNGRVSRAEWESFFEKLAGDKDYMTPEDLRAALFPPTSRGRGGRPPSTLTLMKGLLTGELGSMSEGPAVGDKAPEFRLPTHDGKSSIELARFRGSRPVVLIFGSFT
jgi:EF hand